MRKLKIVVTGPHSSGKSTFLKTLIGDRVINIESDGTTVAFDFGTLSHNHSMLHFFGMPGLDRFRVVREVLSRGMHGLILVVDSSNPRSVAKAKQHYAEICRGYRVPCVVAANKQDRPGALSPSQIRQTLGLNLPVVPVVAHSGRGVADVVKTMFGLMERRLFRSFLAS